MIKYWKETIVSLVVGFVTFTFVSSYFAKPNIAKNTCLCSFGIGDVGTAYDAATDTANVDFYNVWCVNGNEGECDFCVDVSVWQQICGSYVPVLPQFWVCYDKSYTCPTQTDTQPFSIQGIGGAGGPGNYKVVWKVMMGTCDNHGDTVIETNEYFTVN